MTEGKTYVCNWKRTDSGYEVWVARRRALIAQGATFREADQKLWEVIGLATGDAESVRQYIPPEPAESPSASWELGRLRDLGGGADCSMRNPADLFQHGLCSNCLMPIGARTDAVLQVDSIESGPQLASATLPRCPIGAGPRVTLVTDDFLALALFTDDERAMFEWRPVRVKRKGKRNFHELIPRVTPTVNVGIKGRETYHGRCESCGATWVVPSWLKGAPGAFVSARDLPNPLPSLIAIGRWMDPSLAVSEERWAQLAGRPGMKGVSTLVTAIVDESVVERTPNYRPRPREKRPDEAAPWFR
jgi:predicted RNase H-like HicB family nuclease